MKRLLLACGVIAIAATLGACRAQSPEPPAPVTPPAAENPAAGLRLAPGLYDQEDGTVQALGTLDYSDLEGGFWLITDGTKAEGAEGKTVAVIANGGDFASQLEPLKGSSVTVKGTRLDGVSTRMAGPEIEMTSVEAVTDTPGIAE